MRKINLACIIEDDPVHLFITNRLLSMSGLIEKILVCNNGKDAFETLRAMFLAGEKLPELILLDLNMPIWNGWEFLDQFIKIPVKQKILVYILTSSVNHADKIHAERYSLQTNYIVKPITIDSLKKILLEDENTELD